MSEHAPVPIIPQSFGPGQPWIHTFHGRPDRPVSMSAGAPGRGKDTLSFFPSGPTLLPLRPGWQHSQPKEAARTGQAGQTGPWSQQSRGQIRWLLMC